jgi:pimeloyl-ACP methyl ester carboxylesterase
MTPIQPGGNVPTHPTLILVHGGWHGAWCWSKFQDVLTTRGITSKAVDLTSQGRDAGSIGDLRSDTTLLRSTIEEVGGPVVVLAHSAYGGMVITEAADGLDQVQRLIYLTSFVPEVGESLLGLFGGGALPPWMQVSDDGLLSIADGWGRKLFYSDCDPDTAAWAESQLLPQSGASFQQQTTKKAWRKIPASYIVTTDDQTMAPSGQRRMASRLDDVVEIRSGHSPFLSHPEALADLVVERL